MDFYLYTHPNMPLSKFSSIMQELVEEMNFLEMHNELDLPLKEHWESLPYEWAKFTKEVYDCALPIKVVVNAEDYPFKIYVLEDFRDVFMGKKEER